MSTGATGLQRVRSRGKDMGRPITAQVVKKRCFLGKYIPHAASAQQTIWPLCVHLYIIYSIYLYMCIIIFIYVLFSDKRFPMPCHTLSIQVCRSTCSVKCKHIRWKRQKLQFASNILGKKKHGIFLSSNAHKVKHNVHQLLHNCASRWWVRDFLNVY